MGLPARPPQLQPQIVRAPRGNRSESQCALEPPYLYLGHSARVPSVEPVRNAKDRRQAPDSLANRFVEPAEIPLLLLRLRTPMVPRHVRDDDLLGRRHTQQLGVLDKMVRVLVVL